MSDLVLALALAVLPSGAAAAPAEPAADARKVWWEKETFDTRELPEELPSGAREALEYWRPWIEEHDYVVQLAPTAEFLLVTHKKKFSKRDWAKAVEVTLERIDELCPLPDREETEPETGVTEASSAEGMSWSWGEVIELEHHAVAFFELKNSEHMRSLLDYVAEREEKERGWASRYEDLPGLILHRPLAGVIVKTAPGVEEWDPLNEMVNRIARLMVVRRFGKVPFWLNLGIAWNVEMEVRGNIFCFPNRDSFVGVAEHNGWRDSLKRQFDKRNGPLLDMNGLASWQRGTYDSDQAGRAWGVVKYVIEAKPEALSAILEDLRLLIEEKGKIHHADGTWELIPNFQPSPDDQTEVFRRHLGPDFLEDVTSYFFKGMKRPKRL